MAVRDGGVDYEKGSEMCTRTHNAHTHTYKYTHTLELLLFLSPLIVQDQFLHLLVLIFLCLKE